MMDYKQIMEMPTSLRPSDVDANPIESVVGDDFCEELVMSNANRKLRGRIAVAHKKLAQIYRLAHAFNTKHSCHHVHKNWREELKKFNPARAHGGSGGL